MKSKPRLKFWQIWNMSFGFLGIQFGFALQNANVSRIFETLGANIEDIPILWIAAPVTGLIVQPIIGHMSDRTWNRLGRRRPYFLTGAILASIALIIMPNSPVLWVAAGMLWIMDASINISMEPFRAFVGDMLPSDQRTKGFAMQSFFIGIGAVVASILPWMMTNWLNIPNVAPEGEIPLSVKYSFYLGAAIFFLAVLWTVSLTKEYSPEQLKEFEEARKKAISNKDKEIALKRKDIKYFRNFIFWIITGGVITWLIFNFKWDKELYILGLGLFVFGIIQLIAGFMKKKGKTSNGFYVIVDDMFNMPKTMGQLAFVQFFSWFALFAMWINTTNGVTATHFDMRINRVDFTKTLSLIDNTERTDNKKKKADFKTELDRVEKKLKSYKTTPISINLTKYLVSDSVLFEKKELVDFIKSNKENLLTEKNKEYFENPTTDIPMPVVNAINANIKQLDFKNITKENLLYWLKLKDIQQEYNTGADWVGVLFAVYNGLAALFAFLLIYLAKLTNRKITHIISLLIGGLGFVSIYLIKDPYLLPISFVGIGLVWASILAMPYAILTGSLPSEKLGVYMGIFNFFIVIPQIVAASILGFFISKVFGGEAIYALVLGGISLFIAAILTIFVNDVDYVKNKNK